MPPTIVLVGAWYASSVLAIITAKLTLQTLHIPALLCLLQLTTATILQRSYLAWFPPTAIGLPKLFPRVAPTRLSTEARAVRSTALAYALGFALTNLAFSLAPPSTVETLKSGEPIATVTLAAIVLGETERLLTYLTLAPTVLGTAMACYGGESLDLTALVATMASNVAFAGRAVLVKALKRDHPSSPAALSDLVLFYHVSRSGALLLLPLAAAEAYSRSSEIAAQLVSRPSMLLTVLANCVAHASYNQLSFQVLSRVSTSSHAVLNISRRVCLIVLTVVVFDTRMYSYNWAGVALAAFGVLMFGREKSRPGAKRLFSDRVEYEARGTQSPGLDAVVVDYKLNVNLKGKDATV